jgi:hypothetical protein
MPGAIVTVLFVEMRIVLEKAADAGGRGGEVAGAGVDFDAVAGGEDDRFIDGRGGAEVGHLFGERREAFANLNGRGPVIEADDDQTVHRSALTPQNVMRTNANATTEINALRRPRRVPKRRAAISPA